MDRRFDRGRSTRDAFIAVAERLFTSRGYDDTSIELVIAESAVSRGALYHHFENKKALFAAVLETVEARVARHVTAAALAHAEPVEMLRAGCHAWLDLAGDAVVRRILLMDAPAVVGWRAWREIDDRHALGLMKAALGGVAKTGRIAPSLVEPYAHVVLAALIELSLLIARSPDEALPTLVAHEAADVLVDGLLAPRHDRS